MARRGFSEQLEAALAGIVEMIGLVDAAVAQVTDALLTGDLTLAELVISQDDAIDDLYRRLERAIHEMLARQAPVAGDLRTLIAIIRMIADVERAGDLALNIARTVQRIGPVALPDDCGDLLARMGEQARVLLREASTAVRDREPETAERLDLMDDVMDELSDKTFALLAVPGRAVEVGAAMHLALVARCYERIADHAVAVAERVEYLVTGAAHESHVGL